MRTPLLLATLLLSVQQIPDWQRPGLTQNLVTLSFDGREFKNTFNLTSDRARLVLVFSPT